VVAAGGVVQRRGALSIASADDGLHVAGEGQEDLRTGEMWGDVGRCGEMWGDVRRCEEMWGDVGRGWERVKRLQPHISRPHLGARTSTMSANPRLDAQRSGVIPSSSVICSKSSTAEVIRGHQRSSEVIRGHQRSSEVIRGH
jgi:hypothetical protein